MSESVDGQTSFEGVSFYYNNDPCKSTQIELVNGQTDYYFDLIFNVERTINILDYFTDTVTRIYGRQSPECLNTLNVWASYLEFKGYAKNWHTTGCPTDICTTTNPYEATTFTLKSTSSFEILSLLTDDSVIIKLQFR